MSQPYPFPLRRWVAVALLLLCVGQAAALDIVEFDDVRVLGNRRIADEQMLALLPFSTEKSATRAQISEAIRRLYALKYFDDVRISRVHRTLLIQVVERPTIAEITIEGNKAIPTEGILDVLQQAEIIRGEIYNRGLVGVIQQELLKAYHNEGRYNAIVDTSIERLGQAGVLLEINITEGSAFLIRQIRVNGNQQFTQKELTSQFQLGIKRWYNWFSSKNRYSRTRLETDLEVLQSYYQDRGYIGYRNLSTHITLDPDHSAVFINVSVFEGEQYTVDSIALVAPESISHLALEKLIQLQEGAVFSHKKATDSITVINDFLSNYGYTYSAVDVSTEIIDEDKNLIDLRFIVKPGERHYINKITFSGNFSTRDEILRRELRQFEGSLYSKARLERSKIRLQRLGFIESAEYTLRNVGSGENLLDVHYEISERQSGSFTVGASYSAGFGFSFNLGLTQDNFLSTGDFVSVQAQRNVYSEVYSLSYRSAYFTNTGVSRTLAYYRSSYNPARLRSTYYLLDTDSVSITYQVPLTEFVYWSTGFQLRTDRITPSSQSPGEIRAYLFRNGIGSNSLWFNNSIRYDTLNRSLFPTRGSSISVGYASTLVNTSFNYAKVSFSMENYVDLTSRLVFVHKFEAAFGLTYSSQEDSLPPYEKYHLGGISNMRAFRIRGLGPLDSRGGRFGGDAFYYGALEMQINPLSDLSNTGSGAARIVLFADYGYVFPKISDTNLDELRYDLGVGVTWITPIGPLLFSYALPFNHDRSVDNVRQFQFSIGSSF
ncbi:MAG: outer membrane protein assembly factor BamA [Proteobacteria bacterium]|nr:outer membrane protein assembly factor BamA [Pseudomonadota bacterium]